MRGTGESTALRTWRPKRAGLRVREAVWRTARRATLAPTRWSCHFTHCGKAALPIPLMAIMPERDAEWCWSPVRRQAPSAFTIFSLEAAVYLYPPNARLVSPVGFSVLGRRDLGWVACRHYVCRRPPSRGESGSRAAVVPR